MRYVAKVGSVLRSRCFLVLGELVRVFHGSCGAAKFYSISVTSGARGIRECQGYSSLYGFARGRCSAFRGASRVSLLSFVLFASLFSRFASSYVCFFLYGWRFGLLDRYSVPPWSLSWRSFSSNLPPNDAGSSFYPRSVQYNFPLQSRTIYPILLTRSSRRWDGSSTSFSFLPRRLWGGLQIIYVSRESYFLLCRGRDVSYDFFIMSLLLGSSRFRH